MFVFVWLAILTLIAGISASQSQVYMSHNRGYRGISVHIEADIGKENCAGTIQNIKDMFTAGSLVLHQATNFTASPVHFSQVTIVTPPGWSDSDCGAVLGTVTGNTLYKHPDLVIVPGGARHTVQGAQCGQGGHQISLPVGQLGSGSSANLLVSEWSRLRYGVYPELGWAGDNLYPNYYYESGHVLPTGASNTLVTGSWRYQNLTGGCDPTQPGSLCHFVPEGPNTGLTCSLNTRPELPTVTSWCEEPASSGPDMQSVLCGGRSVREVIAQHRDFATSLLSSTNPTPVAPPPSVTFSIVRQPQPKYILILETSARMTAVWQSVRKAVVNLLRYEIPEGSEVGIVTFSSGANVRHSLTRLTGDATIRLRLSDSVPDTANKLSSSRVGCVRCGVRTAMDQLLRSREAGAHLVIITASEGEDSVSSLDLDSLTEYVDYYNIRLSSLVLQMSGSLSSHYTDLAVLSGGVSVVVAVAGDSVSLLSGLVTSLETVLNVDSAAQTYQTVAVTGQRYENKTTQGHFVIDSMLGSDSLFGVLVEDDENHHIKSVTFTDHQGAVFGPFTKMSSQLDDINLKTINFPVGLRPPFDEEARLGQVWKYHISWYEDPDKLDNVVMVRSRPRVGADRLEVSSWTNERDVEAGGHTEALVLYVKVSVAGLPVVAAEVGLRLLHIDNNGAHHLVNNDLTLADDGAADCDLTQADGVYCLSLSPHLLEPGTYQLSLTLSSKDNSTYLGSPLPGPSTCCGSVMSHSVSRHTGAFTRQVAGPVIHRQSGNQPSLAPARVTDFRVEFRESSQQVELTWSPPASLLEVESYTLSYSANINTVIRGDQTRDTVILAKDTVVNQGVLTQVLPGPDLTGVVYFTIRARDSAGGLGPVSNIVYLNITTSVSSTSSALHPDLEEYNYTLLGAILGIITVFSLLTILAVSCWLQRRRHSLGKLRSLHGFSNKVSSGVNVVIDKSTSKLDSDPALHRHVATSSINSSSPVPPSSTSFANNITPTYWSASQLLADHEHRKRDNPNNYHHHHHGHHYHQYYPVHHESHFEDHDSDLLEDNNNEHNTSDHSSSTIVMLNTSLSSGGTGSVKKKNITQV